MLLLGHRGAPRRLPENTIASFLLALELGADGVELDVRLTSDHRLAIRHDDQVAGGSAISGSTLEEARAIEPDLPTLDQVLDVLTDALTVVEMKSQGDRNEAFAELVVPELAGRSQRLTVSSFDVGLLDLVRKRRAGLRTALLVGRLTQEAGELVHGAARSGHSELHAHWSILDGPDGPAVFAAARDAGLDVVAWTVNDPAQGRALKEQGVTAVISDVPDQLR